AEVTLGGDGVVDALCLSLAIGVRGASHDAGVVSDRAIQPEEIAPVQGQDGASVLHGEAQNLFIGNAPPRIPGLGAGEDVVAEASHGFDDGPRHVLVRIELSSHHPPSEFAAATASARAAAALL